jgi:hypothetical protein
MYAVENITHINHMDIDVNLLNAETEATIW